MVLDPAGAVSDTYQALHTNLLYGWRTRHRRLPNHHSQFSGGPKKHCRWELGCDISAWGEVLTENGLKEYANQVQKRLIVWVLLGKTSGLHQWS